MSKCGVLTLPREVSIAVLEVHSSDDQVLQCYYRARWQVSVFRQNFRRLGVSLLPAVLPVSPDDASMGVMDCPCVCRLLSRCP